MPSLPPLGGEGAAKRPKEETRCFALSAPPRPFGGAPPPLRRGGKGPAGGKGGAWHAPSLLPGGEKVRACPGPRFRKGRLAGDEGVLKLKVKSRSGQVLQACAPSPPPSPHRGEGVLPHGPSHGLHVLFLWTSKPYARPFAGQFWTLSNQTWPAASHFGPWQAMTCGDKRTPVPALVHKRIIKVCRALEKGSARTTEIVNQGATRLCRPSGLQGKPLCVPQTPPESPLQKLKQHG